jgi:Zn-dependent protease
MAVYATRGGSFSDPLSWISSFALRIPGLIVGITLHEFAHAKAADMLGDPTPRQQGRVTLNPLRHFDPIGLGALIIIGFGWGKAVQISPMYFRNRRLGGFIVSIAGVAANFVAALVFTGVATLVVRQAVGAGAGLDSGYMTAITLIFNVVWLNLALMIFNLLPVPPLDGFNVVTEIFDLRRYRAWHTVYNYGFPILMALIMLGVTGRVMTPAVMGLLGGMEWFWGAVLP